MMDLNSKIYVAGHNGMAGSAIIRSLKRNGYNNIIYKTHSELDLTNQISTKDFFNIERPDYIFLASAKVGGIKKNIESPVEMLLENLKIQNNVIENSFLYNVKRLLFLGSSCIYPRLCKQPMIEDYFLTGPFEPTNEGYAIAKVAGLRLCEYYNRQYSFNRFISIMPCNLYGLNDHYDENGHVISSLINRFHIAKCDGLNEVKVWGTGKQRREFMYVDDMADAAIFLINNYFENQFINVGTGVDYSLKEIAGIIADIVGYKGKIVFDTTKPDGMPQKLLNVSKLHALGFKHKIDIEEGIKLTYEDYLKRMG